MQLLRDKDINPADDVLKEVLGKDYSIFCQFMQSIEANEIAIEWRYYNDGKAWLCKATHKKKTAFWLSIWEGFFKVSFFFTEKTKQGVLDLPINTAIKTTFSEVKATGKLLPLIVDINAVEQLEDLTLIVNYKKSLK